MLKTIRQAVRDYTRKGITRDTPSRECERIVLTHAIALTFAIMTIQYVPIFWHLGFRWTAIFTAAIVTTYCSLPHVTCRLGFAASRALLTTVMCTGVSVVAAYIGMQTNVQVVMFGIVALPFVITSTGEKWLLGYCAALPTVSYMFLEALQDDFPASSLSTQTQARLSAIIVPTAFLVLFVALSFFAITMTRAERTLDDRNREMALVLSNVEQGLVTVSLDGRLASERSAALDRWFGAPETGATLWSYLGRLSPAGPEQTKLAFERLVGGPVPCEEALDELRTGLTFEGRRYAVDYRPICEQGKLVRLLLVITDMTDELAQRRADECHDELAHAVHHLVTAPASFFAFLEASARLVDTITAPTISEPERLHAARALARDAAHFGLKSIVHACERTVGDAPLAQDVREHWDRMMGFLEPFFGLRDQVTVPFDVLDAISNSARCGMSPELVARSIEDLSVRRADRLEPDR